MKRYCKKCGEELDIWMEGPYCPDCEEENMDDLATAIIHTDELWPNEEEFQ